MIQLSLLTFIALLEALAIFGALSIGMVAVYMIRKRRDQKAARQLAACYKEQLDERKQQLEALLGQLKYPGQAPVIADAGALLDYERELVQKVLQAWMGRNHAQLASLDKALMAAPLAYAEILQGLAGQEAQAVEPVDTAAVPTMDEPVATDAPAEVAAVAAAEPWSEEADEIEVGESEPEEPVAVAEAQSEPEPAVAEPEPVANEATEDAEIDVVAEASAPEPDAEAVDADDDIDVAIPEDEPAVAEAQAEAEPPVMAEPAAEPQPEPAAAAEEEDEIDVVMDDEVEDLLAEVEAEQMVADMADMTADPEPAAVAPEPEHAEPEMKAAAGDDSSVGQKVIPGADNIELF